MKEVNQIINNIKKGDIKPVYFLAGEETFFIDQISDYIENNLLPENAKSFDQIVLYGLETNVPDILLQARRFPMIGDKQVIIVKEAQHLFKKKAETEALENYLQHPADTSVLVINYKGKKLDKRKKIAKLLQKSAVYFESPKMYDNKVPTWIMGTVKSMGYTIDIKSAQMLVDYLGNNLSKIYNELTKLQILIPKKSAITPEIIEKNIGISKDYNNFELKSAIAYGKYVKAQQIINYFSANPKEHPIVVTMGVLYKFFRDLFIYHSLSDKSNQSVSKALNIHSFFINEFQVASRLYPMKKVTANIEHLKIADLKSKGVDSGSMTHADILNELIYKLMH